MIYSVDTSVFIRGWYQFYPPDLFPGVWRYFDSHIANGSLIATTEVLNELEKQRDDLLEWCKARKDVFVDIDHETQLAVADIMAKHARLVDTREAVSPADAWVIALAQTKGATVVTEETHSNSAKRIRIPDVCGAMNIPCMNTIEMMRELGWKFS